MKNRFPPLSLLICALLFAAGCGGAGGGDGDGPGPVDVTRFGTPREIGTGVLNGTTLDGSAAYVEEADERFPEPGCEGQPNPAMFRLPLAGGERQLVGGGDTPLHGNLVRGGSEGQVAIVAVCESFFTDLWIGRESRQGEISDLRRVTPSVPENFLLNATTVSWSNDGSTLLGALQDVNAPDGAPAQVVTINPESGQITKLFDAEQGTGVFKVGQMKNGRYVVATNLVVSFRDEAGVVLAGFQGQGFEIAPGGEEMVVFGRNLMRVPQGGTRASQVVEQIEGREITSAHFSPDGEAVAITRLIAGGGEVEVAIVTLEDSELTSVVTAAPYGPAWFSGDGRALVFTQLGGEPDFTSRVYVTRFEEAG
ncbi:MAG TPA: hypothetical protein VHJ78_00700 [Actinomycetota bacterium]|nr:hypothetical protein [Actinomycetota bacterium]